VKIYRVIRIKLNQLV